MLQILVLLSALFCSTHPIEFIIRQTENGPIRGFSGESLPGKSVEQYLGVPYAEKPVGNLRFERPLRHQSWMTVLNTTGVPPACLQTDMDYVKMHYPDFHQTDEDCLYLNIYVPQVTDSQRLLAVLVYIHGGSNEGGMGAMLRGDILAAHAQIIVVNFNYRLYALGFLSLHDKDLPGNYGLWDQVQALIWVQENIHHFGGDPRQVTIVGHSAGAMNVGVLMLSPLAKGLYRHAVMMSGGALSYWGALTNHLQDKFKQSIKRYIQNLSCTRDTIAEIKKCLKTLKNPNVFLGHDKYNRPSAKLLPFPIVIDDEILKDFPRKLLDDNKAHAHSVMLGFTKDESIELVWLYKDYMQYYEYLFHLDDLKRKLGDIINVLAPYEPRSDEFILYEYLNWQDPDNADGLLQSYSELDMDSSYAAPGILTADLLSKDVHRKVYVYSFDYNFPNPDGKWKHGIEHGRDIFYLFGLPFVGHQRFNFTDEDRKMSGYMMELYGNFVKTGTITLPTSPAQKVETYNSKSKAYIKYFNNDDGSANISVFHSYKPRRMHFWNSLISGFACKSNATLISSRLIMYIVCALIFGWHCRKFF
ncbi:hypothetical protein CHS0354_036832 [Potamilus streckersoni]|uniref:Carboxylic ester hydrolase n=1 Tax=Potamilus streckersoni TaxID=2493646 RepID=A0AAE0VMH9_9BIVA|nr:hypothetical protein CHS0354_036832 [Potamilus streckersoni]